MVESGFPLRPDLPAFLLINQLIYPGALRPTDVADPIQTGRPNLSKIVRRRESAWLVECAPGPRDDQGVVIEAASAGREVARRIRTAVEAANALTAQGWSDEALQNIEHLMVKLARSLDALPGNPLASTAGSHQLKR